MEYVCAHSGSKAQPIANLRYVTQLVPWCTKAIRYHRARSEYSIIRFNIRNSTTRGLANVLPKILPLPGGEGRGEGERVFQLHTHGLGGYSFVSRCLNHWPAWFELAPKTTLARAFAGFSPMAIC